MVRRPISRVRRNICLLLMALLALSWGYFGLSFGRDYITIEQQKSHNLESLALGLEAHTGQIVELIDILLLEMARHYSHHSFLELQEMFNGWLVRLPALAGLAVVDINSEEILFSLSQRAVPAVLITEGAYANGRSKDGLEIAARIYADTSGRHQMALSRQFAQDGRQLRVVSFLYADFFLEFHQDLNLGKDGSVAIFHDSGLLLARKPHGDRLVGRSFAEGPLFSSLLPRDPVGLSKAPQRTDGVSRLVAHRKLSELPLVVTVGTSIEWIFADWQARFRIYFAIQIVISAAILLLLFMQFKTLSNAEKIEVDLEEREEHFRAVANSSVDAVISANEDERIRFWSAGAEQMFGCPITESLGMPISCFLQFSGKEQPLTLLQLSKLNSPWSMQRILEVQGQRKNGELFPTELSLSRGTASGNALYTLIVRDVTERKQMEERIKKLASHDNLTGLPNRALLMDRLQVAMAQIRRQGGQFALLFVDLDQFKPVNDKFGHDVGDRLLQQVSQRMLDAVRASDTVARLGGDEFALLLLNVDDEAAVSEACSHLLESLRKEFVLNMQRNVFISCSIGVVLFHGQDHTPSELIGQADNAMYDAKRAGKNQFVFSKD